MRSSPNTIVRLGAAIALLAGLLALQGLNAQSRFECQGGGCQFLPLSQDKLTRMLTEFQQQYTNTLFDDMAEAAVVANISGPPIGSVNLAGFTFGFNTSLAVVQPHDVTVTVPGESEVQDLPSAGAAVSPRVFVGANLGQIIGLDYDPFSKRDAPAFYSPSRFDVYLSLMDVEETYQTQGTGGGKVTGAAYFRGVEVRYHLLEGAELGSFLFRWLGVSVGAGIFTTRQSVLFELNEQQQELTFSGQKLKWDASASVDWKTRVDSYPIEVRTGIQVLYVLRLTVAAGVSSNKGSTDFLLSMSGPVYTESDLAQSLGYELPNAALFLDIAGTGRVPSRLTYGKVGIEFNFWALQLGVEATVSKRTYGANIGIRTEL